MRKIVSIVSVLVIILLIITIFYNSIEIKINQTLWKLSRPDIYYLEVSDTIQGDEINTIVVVEGENIIYQDPKREVSSIPEILTLEQIFDLANKECSSWNNCIIRYDHARFITELAIYDWRVLKVDSFLECESLKDCLEN